MRLLRLGHGSAAVFLLLPQGWGALSDRSRHATQPRDCPHARPRVSFCSGANDDEARSSRFRVEQRDGYELTAPHGAAFARSTRPRAETVGETDRSVGRPSRAARRVALLVSYARTWSDHRDVPSGHLRLPLQVRGDYTDAGLGVCGAPGPSLPSVRPNAAPA